MYRITIITILFFNLSNPILAKAPFVGKVILNVESPDTKGDIELYVGKKGVRADMNLIYQGNSSPMLSSFLALNDKAQTAFLLNHNSKSYSRLNFSQSAKLSRFNSKLNPYIVKTIGNETISGYKCLHVQAIRKKTTVDLWFSNDVLDFNVFRKLQKSTLKFINPSLASALEKAGIEGFPIKIVQKNVFGEKLISTVKGIKKQRVPASMFQIPKSYIETQSLQSKH